MSPPTPPSWIHALEGRAGPLYAPAVRFLGAHTADAQAFPRGAQGLIHLAAIIDRWHCADEADDSDDHAFTEGAGALLALVLIDHLPGGRYVGRERAHRVRLGEHGFFNPFTSIERVIDAQSSKKALVDEVRIAEAEAAGRGPVSRVVAAFTRLLAEERAELMVLDQFDAGLVLTGGIEVDCGRVVEATADQGEEAVRKAIEKLVAMLPGGRESVGVTWEEAGARVLPRLVGTAFLTTLRASAEASGSLFHRPLAQDLSLAVILDFGGRARFVRRREIEGWSIDEAELERRAIANLAARSARARFARVDTPEGAIVVARTGDGLDAARLLLPSLFQVLSPELGEPFYVAAPHRDKLIAAPAGPSSFVDAVRARVADDARRAPHPISAELFLIERDRPLWRSA